VREKDGLWAVLAWLSILADSRESVETVVRAHWAHYGRDFYARHDFEGLSADEGDRLVAALRDKLPGLPGTATAAGPKVFEADEFAYTDPIDGYTAARQGIRVWFENGARAVFRLSGTGTAGATLRIYLEQWVGDPLRHNDDTQDVLLDVAAAAREIADLQAITGRVEPSLVI
jgi:phosphoglucomutase